MQIKGEPNGHREYFSIDFENIWLKIPKIKEGMKMKNMPIEFKYGIFKWVLLMKWVCG